MCLPYSPTKTLSVKSILRYVFTKKLSVKIFICMPFPVIQTLCYLAFMIGLFKKINKNRFPNLSHRRQQKVILKPVWNRQSENVKWKKIISTFFLSRGTVLQILTREVVLMWP